MRDIQSCFVRAIVAVGVAGGLSFASGVGAPRTGGAAEDWTRPKLEQAFAALGGTRIPDGRLYAPFYEGVIAPHAVVEKDEVFCAFQNSIGQPVAMVYDPVGKTWQGPVKAAEFGLKGDDHGNPSLILDRRGYLHIFYGCHGGPMRHTRSRQPYDVSSWEEQSSPTPRATYPQSMRTADGAISLFYRAGGHMAPWTSRTSTDDGRSWSEPRPIIEMRRDPPDPLAAAYCCFFPGHDLKTVHVFWNHKDDNAARVTPTRPHPWRPLKYPGLHEAVYRYNVYYARQDRDSVWRNAAGELLALPISKREADARCMVYDSGDIFTMIGARVTIDTEDRPYVAFRTGVVDWVKAGRDPSAVIVPLTYRYASCADGKWRVVNRMPSEWPPEVREVLSTPGAQAYGERRPEGRWFIRAEREAIGPGVGCSVFLYHGQMGYAVRKGGPAVVE